MARKKKKKFFIFGGGKKKTKSQRQRRNRAVMFSLKIIFFTIVIVVIAVGLFFLDKDFVKKRADVNTKWVKMKLVNSPDWMSNDLRRMIFETAGDGNGWFKVSENSARDIYNKLYTVSWLYDLKVKAEPNSIELKSDYYEPAVLVKSGGRMVYIASDREIGAEDFNLKVLSYVPIYDLQIPEVDGIETRYMPEAGLTWEQEDIHAAVEIVNILKLMDQNMLQSATAKQRNFSPLLNEIGSIDVSNFNGRKSKSKPHIVLYSNDETPIFWGALNGNLEAVRVEKLGKLYQCYKDFGTLQLKSKGLVKYVDLRTPEKINPIP